MAMFTGVIKLAQIDDYINPSQSCIKPQIMKPDIEMKKATVSLNDCLACSGCITSAQSILVEQMSLQKLIKQITDPTSSVYLFISPQSIASLSHHYGIKCQQLMRCLRGMLRQYYPAVKEILDMRVAIEVCHQLIWQQYLQVSETRTILCSECPGWVCYAQKTLNQDITQFMSKVKSPQQILGRMIKTIAHQNKQNNCYVAAVMPCYDKKLQAIRFDMDEGKEVDLTITTGQLYNLIQEALSNNNKIFKQFINTPYQPHQLLHHLTTQDISFLTDQTSNGYINYILSKLSVKYETSQVKNSDFIEYRFIKDGKERKMAKCYGFRNIQKIVQLIKKNKCPYEYVEVMACPGGCFGGGGQLKSQNLKVKQLISEMKDKCKENKQIHLDQALSKIIQVKDMKTQYKALEKSISTNINNW